MKLSRMSVYCLIAAFILGATPGMIRAEEFRIAVLKGTKDSTREFKALAEHLVKSGVSVSLVEVPTYDRVTKLFSEGQVDAVFSGSGIPGSMFTIHRLKLKQTLTGFKPKESDSRQAMVSR
jgi:ABC-type phosphate/phosphonate transport system substrate-binding protein